MKTLKLLNIAEVLNKNMTQLNPQNSKKRKKSY